MTARVTKRVFNGTFGAQKVSLKPSKPLAVLPPTPEQRAPVKLCRALCCGVGKIWKGKERILKQEPASKGVPMTKTGVYELAKLLKQNSHIVLRYIELPERAL